MKFTFIDWLTLLNPNTTLKVTIDDKVYSGKRTNGSNFNMTLTGYIIEGIEFKI